MYQTGRLKVEIDSSTTFHFQYWITTRQKISRAKEALNNTDQLDLIDI